MLFVNPGVGDRAMIGDVSTDEFIRAMVTNALSPLRAGQREPQQRRQASRKPRSRQC